MFNPRNGTEFNKFEEPLNLKKLNKDHKTNWNCLIICLSIGLIVTPYLLDDASAGSLVEFKKYKVINSSKVCGDKLCSTIDEQRSQKGLSTRDIKICGDSICNGTPNEKTITLNKSSQLGQYKLGLTTDLIECREGQTVIIKVTTHLPACVNIEHIEKFRERNWAVSEQTQQDIFEKLTDDRNKVQVTNKTLADFDIGLNITPEKIADQRYLAIEGFGWHRLHNVEIMISSQDFKESIRSQTTDRGDLSTLWQIPDSVGDKMYNIFATDGIHEFELNIPIATKLN